jgi:hypothetical protein
LGAPLPLAVLENPGFELPVSGVDMPGWTSLLPMGTTMQIDSNQRASGAQSIKLTSTGANVRVVSGSFAPPATGRLAIEVRLRSESQGRQPSVRLFVEGDLRDSKFEPYGVIPAVGAGASAPGEWMSYSFPISYLPSEGLESIKVGFELLGPGEVWIDDFQVFDLAFEKTERYELSKLISLASVVLEKRQFADCSQLLESYWPQFLVANVPLAQAGTPVARTPGSRAPIVPPPPAKRSTVLENLKEYLPRLPGR